MYTALVMLAREYRRTRAAMLRGRKKVRALDREALEAIRARHPHDVDVDALLIDIIFLHDCLDVGLDERNVVLENLAATQRENARLRREIHQLRTQQAAPSHGGTVWL